MEHPGRPAAGSGPNGTEAPPLAQPVAYDVRSQSWRVDVEGAVGRNDVVYDAPSTQAWEAMPVGGGDLSAMVRYDGTLHLHLHKSDACGLAAATDAPSLTRFFTPVSPGHVVVRIDPSPDLAGAGGYEQRLDLYRGQVTLRLGTGVEAVHIQVWGHPKRRLLVVEIDDARPQAAGAVVLDEWRDGMRVRVDGGHLLAAEVSERAAAPHLANAGMDGHFTPQTDPLLGRGVGVAVGVSGTAQGEDAGTGHTAALSLDPDPGGRRVVYIAVATTHRGDPLTAARQELQTALAQPLEQLRAEQRHWWEEYWRRSWLVLRSGDEEAEYLAALWYVHLYTLGCTNRGPWPASWHCGAGMLESDRNCWGLSRWVQEIRMTYWPLPGANRLEMARGVFDFYAVMLPYLREQTRRVWGLDGLWIPETVLPWGHAEDLELRAQPPKPADGPAVWTPVPGQPGRFHSFNPYVGFLFSAGLEIAHYFLQYARYTGDQDFVNDQAYPVVRGVCEFYCNLARRGDDGCFHLDPANALETWWLVRDPAPDLAGLRVILPQFISLAADSGQDHELRRRCEDLLAGLPPLPTGRWDRDGTVDSEVDTFAPAAAPGATPGHRNEEHAELYAVFPFGWVGLDSVDLERARRTFSARLFPSARPWSQCPLVAARLGLAEEAWHALALHARHYQRYPFGGWTSSDSVYWPNGLSVAPFLDAGGLHALGLQECLLQSHGGVIRVVPALPGKVSGVFRLRAEGGFLVSSELTEGHVRYVVVESERGGRCRVANPFGAACRVTVAGREVLVSREARIVFATEPGRTYLLEPEAAQIGALPVAEVTECPFAGPGVRGQAGRVW